MLKRMRLKRPPLVLFVALLVVAVLMMVSLPGAVENAYSSVTLTWTPPTTNSDGTELTDLAGYLVYYGTSSGSYGSPIDVGNVNTYSITNLAAGSYYFAVKAYDTARINSDFSNEVLKVQQGTSVPTTPTPDITTPTPDTTTPTPDTTTPTVNTFTVPATAKSLTVSITSFTAMDNVGVTGYIITESATTATASSWSMTAPTSYTAAAAGKHTLYAYAKDAAGNVSAAKSASVNITVTTTTSADTTRPTVNAFTIPVTATSLTFSITSITATDSVGVTGYIITESPTRPSATASSWSMTAPTSYTAAAAGKHTLYAYAKDAAGNVSAAKSASINITGTAVALSDEIAIFFNGAWYIDTNGNGMWDGTTTDTLYPNFGNGLYGAVPVTGDWDGSGVVKIGVFSNGTWYLDMNGNGVWDGPSVDKVISNFGQGLPNVIPVTGDWNGTGTTKIGVFSNGTWYLDMNGNGIWEGASIDNEIPDFGKGMNGAIPVILKKK